ncbi:related to Target of rapamycin complex 1 subunit KOG1 [Hanseniaspora guilliermondii]|uniref:Related to Target of rapamycin complex 1 subunit KOG1 n=1 Tax=Hanseniaspora guilliermondii TaxID=56406 RepID=A0A1L0CYG8_9ASCO|nr:related to Target of rapamycin complex 1 subunit KOG1 [Hanseniaspora guilliermondii]
MTNLETLFKESLKPTGLRNNNIQTPKPIPKNNTKSVYTSRDDENVDKSTPNLPNNIKEKSPPLDSSNHFFTFDQDNFSSDILNNSMLLKPLNQQTRHGFDEEYTNLEIFENDFLFYFDDKRHQTNGNPVDEETIKMDKDRLYQPIMDWKIGKERIKTVAAALVLCLHLGVDPPDVVKTQPCARVESSIDYLDYQDSKKAIEAIGKSLQSRYELLSPRTKYKLSLDPCVEDLKRFCNSLRKSCKNERVLFHYNGHGVPKPTTSGEIWIFNRGYTQYIPVSLYDLQNWLGAPCIYVWDCNQAELIIKNFNAFVEKRKQDDLQGKHDPAAPSTIEQYNNCYQLAACKSDELLPMNEELPADLFTCCLTTPIEISIKIYLMQSPLKDTKYSILFKNSKESNIRDHHTTDKNNFSKMPDIVIPGKSTDRRTPLGELNWIFTAITDTIAWTTLPRDVFNQLFRHDLITAALFRNFLLAKKLMPIYNCHPVSHPSLPDSIINHPMWKSWDLAIDQVLSKLIDSMLNPTAAVSQQMLLNPKQHQDDPLVKYKSGLNSLSTMSLASQRDHQNSPMKMTQHKLNEVVEGNVQQQYSDFFVQNLTAFELWLKYGSSKKTPPEQLPIVLQVLLSQLHRSKALVLLAKFLDLGPWAVYLSLSIGIFPYVMKLLQGPSAEMKPILVFIWARIMAIDSKNTQTELIKEDGYMYFMQIVRPDFTTSTRQIINGSSASLHNNKKFSQYKMLNHNLLHDPAPVSLDKSGISDNQKAMATFVLACFINGFELGQKYCFNLDFIAQLIFYAENSETALLRQWSILLLSFLYKNTPLFKYVILANKNEPHYGVLTTLSKTLKDPVPEVRTATLVAMTEFISDVNEQEAAYKMYQDLQIQHNNIQQQLFGLQSNPMGNSMQNQSSIMSSQHQLQQQLQMIQSNIQILQNNDIKDTKQEEVRLIVAALSVLNDGSSVVRKELVVLLSKFVNTYMSFFIVIAFVDLTEELIQNDTLGNNGNGSNNNKKSIGHNSIFNTVWKSLLILSEDPHEEIRCLVGLVIGRILFELNDHPELGTMVMKLEKKVIQRNVNVGRLNKSTNKNGNLDDSKLSKTEGKTLLSSMFSSDNFSKNSGSLETIKNEGFSVHKKNEATDVENKSESLVTKFFDAIKTLVGNDGNEMDNYGVSNNEISFSKRLAKLSLINQQYKVSPPAKTPRFEKSKLPTKLDTYLKSKFFDYSKEYFTCPQMHKEELDEPGSENYLRRQWKTERNDRIIRTTQGEKELSLYGDWSHQSISIDNKTVPKKFKFTQFENYLVTSDERDTIRCFDWKDKENPSSSFSNGNSYGTRISDLTFINEDDDSLLVTCTSDGVMKVYKDFHSTEDTTLVACWRGFTDMLQTPRSTGLISEWQQSTGTFLIGGDVKVIRCWDALTESVDIDIPAKTSSLVTAITSDQLAGNIFAAGFLDGTIRVYDKRVDPRESMMRLWKSGSSGAGNKSSINSLKMQRGGFRELVSGNNDGAVELWDIRYQEPVFGFSATGFDGKSSMTSAQVHEHAPIIASTSKNIELWTTSGDSIGVFKNVTPLNSMVGSLTSKNLSFVNSLIFHPHRMMLAANNLHETSINIYQCIEKF